MPLLLKTQEQDQKNKYDYDCEFNHAIAKIPKAMLTLVLRMDNILWLIPGPPATFRNLGNRNSRALVYP